MHSTADARTRAGADVPPSWKQGRYSLPRPLIRSLSSLVHSRETPLQPLVGQASSSLRST